MPRPITPTEQQEYDALYAETAVLAEFLEESAPGTLAAIEQAKTPRAPFRLALAGLREARSDLLVMVDFLSGEQMRALDALLRARTKVSLDALQSRRLSKLAALRSRGRINSEEQFRLVRGRLDQINR
jgi:hypothetical protein